MGTWPVATFVRVRRNHRLSDRQKMMDPREKPNGFT